MITNYVKIYYMKEEDSLEKNIAEITEWQNKQFDPGYFLGGNIPPFLLRPNKKLGAIFLGLGLIQTILIIVNFEGFQVSQLIILIISVLMIGAGYSKLKGN